MRTIFLVDDDVIYTETLKNYLQGKYDVRLETFSTGEQCLSTLHKKPDLVILDHYLNGVNGKARDGITILRHIKAKLPECEVIMLTGEESTETAVSSIKNGAFDYVVKSDNAMIRIENLINKAFISKRLKENNAKYQSSMFFVTACMAVVCCSSIALYMQQIG